MLDTLVKDAIPQGPYASRMETMGDRLRQCRNSRGLTQQQLADSLGVTNGAVSQWELGGTKNIKLVTFLRVLEILQTSADYLIFGDAKVSASGKFRALRKPET